MLSPPVVDLLTVADLAYYLHDLDPILIQFTEKIAIRWYGLSYVMGFVAGIFLLRFLAKRNYTQLRPDQVADFITYAAIFGVMLGGRLGYMLFYNSESFFRNPLIFFDFLGGGMSSHGGILGLVAFTWFYAKRHKISWPGLGDNLVTVAPVGLFLGRIANFINGELYGRPTNVSWAMLFPNELREPGGAPLLAEAAQKLGDPGIHPDQLVEAARHDEQVRAVLREVLTPRHPSQLYEAAVEGLFLFLVLFIVRLRFKHLPHGILTGMFFILYAIGRISVENFREPDAPYIAAMTRGQFYSLFMILIGLAFWVYAFLKGRAKAQETA